MVYRIFVEKKPGLDEEAQTLLRDCRELLGIVSLDGVRVLNRYDVENITADLFKQAVLTVFSEPQVDVTYQTLPTWGDVSFAVAYLPGQYDQRADSAAQCIQIISCGERPTVATAKVYLLSGALSEKDLEQIKKYVINPVESHECGMDMPQTLKPVYPVPNDVATIEGFCQMDDATRDTLGKRMGLAMDADDLKFCQTYFQTEGRDPTVTEIRMIDTYWSDHCRHTTFLTTIDSVRFADPVLQGAYERYLQTREKLGRTKPINLMDIATIAAKALRAEGKLQKLDESEEINACTVKITVNADGNEEPWLLLFKNETHNHPTEIEPFGGAATCIGGAIRDPLSGRAYVYAAMRVTGAADPTVPVSKTLKGKLPQRKIVTTAAAGYSSYGNQIGLATGQVDECYHPGYVAKRMEIGAVIAAAPAENVRRECPIPGDVVILLGGRTGRDGCGGATGSSKSHTLQSLESCGAEVQKGNAPEERKLQRLFRNPTASRMIKRCNDFGAGGVSVAIGELADGLEIQLDAVPKKYEGLDGTELAISESQERMAVVVSPDDVQAFCRLADEENLEATVVAYVKEEPRLTMFWRGKRIVDLSREFLNSNGAEKHIDITPALPGKWEREVQGDFSSLYTTLASDLNVCSKRGLSERFDSTIGGGTVLMPFGGIYQRTPIQAMVHKISMEHKHTDTVSLMAWGYNPFLTEKSPYHGAYLAVIESVSKLIATGATFSDVYLTFQEYFEKPMHDGTRWGKPLAALLGAFDAQMQLGIAAIGGKDSMSGSFENIDVPPTLVSFAVTTAQSSQILQNAFTAPGHRVILLMPAYDEQHLPQTSSLLALYDQVSDLIARGDAAAVYTPTYGGVAEAVLKMAMGNRYGFSFDPAVSLQTLFGYCYGSFVVEWNNDTPVPQNAVMLGTTTAEQTFVYHDEPISLDFLCTLYENRLEDVYPCNIEQTSDQPIPTFSYTAPEKGAAAPAVRTARPLVLIPAFPGTNCEYDTAKAMEDAGAEAQIMVVRNLTADAIAASVERFASAAQKAQIIFIPGGFSGGDEPDGSGKFITAFFRSEAVRTAVTELLDRRGGLMAGICNGFQALIKLGLVPYGKIIDPDPNAPTLTFNTIGRHQSCLVRTRIASTLSPWLSHTHVGEIYTVPISHGEGRFLADMSHVQELANNGQIATQYVDLDGNPTCDIHYNPNNSVCAIEGITSPDGRVFGKMGHAERVGKDLYRNVPGNFDIGMFRAAVEFFRG